MKKIINLSLIVAIAIGMTSCKTTKQATESRKTEFAPLKRSDYQLTDDFSEKVEMSTWFGLINTKNKAVNYYRGDIANPTIKSNSTAVFINSIIPFVNPIPTKNGNNPAVDLAIYNLIAAHPEFDYFTNVRVLKKERNYIIFKKYEIEVKAKGIILLKK